MEANQFVIELEKRAPTVEHLLEKGYSHEFAEKIIQNYIIKRKPPEPVDYNDSLIRLIREYETQGIVFRGQIELGYVPPYIPPQKDLITVGVIEADPLVLNTKTGKVELIDHENLNFTMAECAISGNRFLDALIMIAGFEPPHITINGMLSPTAAAENNQASYHCAIACANAAGVSAEKSIYEMVLGYGCW